MEPVLICPLAKPKINSSELKLDHSKVVIGEEVEILAHIDFFSPHS
jgi:hypothetical protein